MYEEAIVEIQKGAGEGPSASLAYVYAVMGRSAEAREILNELVELSKGRHVSKANLARVFGALGDRDQAFALLDQAYEEYDSWMFRLQDPVWDLLRDDPRFQDLLRRMNFPEAGATGPPV